jgi:hypothetical protein
MIVIIVYFLPSIIKKNPQVSLHQKLMIHVPSLYYKAPPLFSSCICRTNKMHPPFNHSPLHEQISFCSSIGNCYWSPLLSSFFLVSIYFVMCYIVEYSLSHENCNSCTMNLHHCFIHISIKLDQVQESIIIVRYQILIISNFFLLCWSYGRS